MRGNKFVRHAISAGLFFAFSSHIASAASIVASASASCNVEGVITNSVAPATSPGTASCGTPGQTVGSGLAQFSYSETGASANLYAEALNTVDNSITVNVSVDWTNTVMLTGGTGTAVVELPYTFFPFSYVGCVASVNGTGIGCFNPFEMEFNTPFTLRVLLSGSANAIGFPGSLTGYRVGAGNFDISNVQVRQGGLLVDGADLVAVPEPATWFLPGLGLAVVAAYRQRRR